MFGLTHEESTILRRLNAPKKIQDYLDTLAINTEPEGDTCLSPRRVIREQRAHCIEAAMLAALALRVHRQPPVVLQLTSSAHDFDHVITLFKQYGCFGAISKSNHSVLRYRDPVYKTLRELALSYFHEYIDEQGRKTLRSYSVPMHLSRFDARGWMTNEDHNWFIAEALVAARHIPLVTRAQTQLLRRADAMEMRVGALTEWPTRSSSTTPPS